MKSGRKPSAATCSASAFEPTPSSSQAHPQLLDRHARTLTGRMGRTQCPTTIACGSEPRSTGIAELYAARGPRYPEIVIDDVVELAGFVGRLADRRDRLRDGPGDGGAGRARPRRHVRRARGAAGRGGAGASSRRIPNVRVSTPTSSTGSPTRPVRRGRRVPRLPLGRPERAVRERGARCFARAARWRSRSAHHVTPPGAITFYFEVQEDYDAVGTGRRRARRRRPEEIVVPRARDRGERLSSGR